MNKILLSIFQVLKFFPLVSNAFPLNKQNSPSINSPLSVQEGFKISILKILPLLNTIRYQFEIFQLKIISFKIRVVVRSFCFGLILSPLWHESPKTESLEPFQLLSPLCQIKHMSGDLYQRRRDARSDGEG
jgi:hypothetical protein